MKEGIYNLDCIEGMKQIETGSVNLIITDPPYNFEAFGGGFYDLKNNEQARTYLKKLHDLNCNAFKPDLFLQEFKRICKPFNLVVFCNKDLVDTYINFARDNDFLFDIHFLVKTNPIPAKNYHFLHDTEYIIVIKEKGSYFNNSSRFEDYKKHFKTYSHIGKYHPAQKPLNLISKYIRVLSKKGDLVMDPFLGSGTTALACVYLERKFIGFEIDNKYFDISMKRLKSIPKKLNSFF